MANYKFGINELPHKRWPVAWYNPAVLMRSVLEMIATANQIRNMDRRELFKGEFSVTDLSAINPDQDFWWDFMSDSGDSGNACYSIARAMQAYELPIDDGDIQIPFKPTSRGSLLVLGGDLAYPGASMEEYQYRFVDLWEAARPAVNDLRTLLAIPQNHDWFDNISTFNRHFIGDYRDHFLNANTPQTRSYFAARLPHNWWLLGFDFALVCDLDRAQFDSFVKLIKQDMKPGDNAILLYPEPFWTRPLGDNAREGYPKRYQRLEHRLLEEGIKIRVRLAGDLHLYNRATATHGAGLEYDDMLITCGCGGAFLHPTHAASITKTKVMDRSKETAAMTLDLLNRARVGTCEKKTTPMQREYRNTLSYPNAKQSRCLSVCNLWALFKPSPVHDLYSAPTEGVAGGIFQRIKETWSWAIAGNIMLPITLGLLYWLAAYCNSFVFSSAFEENGFVAASKIHTLMLNDFLVLWFKAFIFSPLAFIVHLVIFLLCFFIAQEDGWKSWVPGVIHGALHVVAVPTLFWLITLRESNPYVQGLYLAGVGVIWSGFLFGCFFSVMSAFGLMANNAFSPLAYEGYKGFLRFRIDPDGNLHGFMIGTDSVPTRWALNPESDRPLWVEKNPDKAPKWKVRDVFVLKK